MSMSKHKQFKIGLLGAGTVGAGVFETLTKDKKVFPVNLLVTMMFQLFASGTSLKKKY